MTSPTKFLKIYKDVANSCVHQDDLTVLYWDLKYTLDQNNDDIGKKFFVKSKPSPIEMAYAVDAVAHNIHQRGKEFLDEVFPGADPHMFKSKLDELAGMESTSEVRKANRGYYTPLLATNGMIFLEKQQVGMTTREDIKNSIAEYENLVKAKIATPAEILTLHRFFGPKKNPYSQIVKKMGLDKEENEPLVVGGAASVVMIDKEGHLITAKALANAFHKFMSNIRTRNMNVFHSDVQAGWVLPAYISKTGHVFKSGVDKHGLWIVAEVRDDTRVAQRMAEEIIKGIINSFSIAGSAIRTKYVNFGSMSYMRVDALELQEITFCLEGVNSQSKFSVLKSRDGINSSPEEILLQNDDYSNLEKEYYTKNTKFYPIPDFFIAKKDLLNDASKTEQLKKFIEVHKNNERVY